MKINSPEVVQNAMVGSMCPTAIAAIAPIIATLGLLGLIRAGIGFIWGHADVQIEAPLSKVGFTFGDTTIVMSPMGLFVLLFVIALMIIVSIVFQRTNIGLALRASAYAPEIAQLAGIRVSGIRTLGWAIAGAAGAALQRAGHPQREGARGRGDARQVAQRAGGGPRHRTGAGRGRR